MCVSVLAVQPCGRVIFVRPFAVKAFVSGPPWVVIAPARYRSSVRFVCIRTERFRCHHPHGGLRPPRWTSCMLLLPAQIASQRGRTSTAPDPSIVAVARPVLALSSRRGRGRRGRIPPPVAGVELCPQHGPVKLVVCRDCYVCVNGRSYVEVQAILQRYRQNVVFPDCQR
jgi:hypothetical protein